MITGVIQTQIKRLRTLIPPGEEFRKYVAHTIDEQIASVTSNAQMGIVAPSVLSKTQLLASARMAAEMIETPDMLAAKPEGIVDLGVIEWLLRPALPLKDDIFDPVESGMWNQLKTDAIRPLSSAVCRLDISINESNPIHVGTGFVAGKDSKKRFVIVTNAHVVEEVLRIGWPANGHIVFGCDFCRFSVEAGGELHALAPEYELHPTYDLALLHLPNEHLQNCDVLNSLTIASHSPEQVIGSKIGVIGHPAFDSRLDPFPKFFGFGNEFGIKRFSPGFVQALDKRIWRGNAVEIFLHDATTLSGSSGSCILDLETKTVVGVHFGGWPLHKRILGTPNGDVLAQLFETNGAVPMWRLRNDPLCSNLSFV